MSLVNHENRDSATAKLGADGLGLYLETKSVFTALEGLDGLTRT